MRRLPRRSSVGVLATLVAVTAELAAQPRPSGANASGRAAPNTAGAAAVDDARDGVVLPEGVRAVRITRGGEVLRVAPDGDSARRGAAARGALLPALEAALGSGCASRWVRVGRDAWVCQDAVELVNDAPRAGAQPVLAPGELVPYHYGFAAYAGVPTYRRLEDIESDERAEELERGMGVAVTNTTRTDDGTVYARTANGRWILHRDLLWARPSERAGVRYDPGEAVTGVAFAPRRAYTFGSPEDAVRGRGPRGTVGLLAARTLVHVREEQMVRGRRVARTDLGWVLSASLRAPDPPAPPPDVGPSERWVDVDTARQMLVAFEGARPVYATLVSTGRRGHPTHPGTFRVWIKLATSTMSNADDEGVDASTSVYSVEHVPWVMYFHDDQALHGVYWHDRFGTPRSHGCVNLSPRDAAWLFDWAPPALPAGWEAVFPSAREPGLMVRVR